MRSPLTRCTLAILAAAVVSGCYSDGRWSAPNLAFWKSNPFQSTPGATPGAVGSPVKPSGIAAATKGTTPSTPPTGYAAAGAVAPSAVSLGTPVGYNAPNTGYPTNQYPAAATTPGAAASMAPSSHVPAYTASTAGVPGASAYGSSPAGAGVANSPYGPSGATPASPYGAPAASAYNAMPAAAATPGGYPPAGTVSDPRNPVRPGSSYSGIDPSGVNRSRNGAAASLDRYSGASADRYSGAGAGAASGYGAGGGSGYVPDTGSRYGATPNTSGPSLHRNG